MARRGRGSVMAIGHVERRDRGEALGHGSDLGGIRDDPERVFDPVAGDEVVGGRSSAHDVDDAVELIDRSVGQEHRLRVRVGLGDVAGPIVLLVGARVLVLLDEALLVLAHAAERDQACLDVLAHALLVDVQAGSRVPHQHAVGNEAPQVVAPLRVDAVVVHIDRWIEVDLGLADVQEGNRVPPRQRARLI